MKDNSRSGGLGFCSVLTIVFIVLKLCDVIHWSWIWVLSPLWIPIILVILFLLFAMHHYDNITFRICIPPSPFVLSMT